MNGFSETTIPVRKGEEIDKRKLEDFLRASIEGLPGGELEIRQFGAGHSNLTYALKIGDWQSVLRKPPLGPVAPKAHDMEREFKILQSLAPIFSAAPKPYVYSEDTTITGSPFFIMERRHGIVLDTEFPAGTETTTELGRKISEKMVDTLVELHAIDYSNTVLAKMAKPEGFLSRQVHGWIDRYERAKTDEIEEYEALKQWMLNNIPTSQNPTIIHYDFKLNNTMFSDDFSAITGLFDWEMTTVGDPLADLGAAMSYWIQQDDPELLKKGMGKPPVTINEGFYSRAEFIRSYADKSGRDVSQIDFYLTFATFKLAVVVQQIYFRYKKGQTQDPRFANFDKFVQNLIHYAHGTIPQ